MRAVLTGILLLVAIADTASARNIFAFQQEGSTDHQKLTNAIAAAEPGDSIYLSKCRERNGEVQCPFPLTWTLDTTVWGKHGVTYVGHSDRGRSTLKMANFGPGDDWDTMRWRDILSFGFQEASSQPTVLRDILFDGNRDHQGAVLNPRCESACPEGWFCQHNWCYHPTCDGCRADEIPCPEDRACIGEPRQEGLLLTARGDVQQDFQIERCHFQNHPLGRHVGMARCSSPGAWAFEHQQRQRGPVGGTPKPHSARHSSVGFQRGSSGLPRRDRGALRLR